MHLEGHLNAEGQADNRLHFIARQRSGIKAENDIMSDMKTIADYSQGLYQLRVPDEEVKRDIAALLAGAVHERLG